METKQFYSQCGEDKWIFENLTLPENGAYLDIGCNDAVNNNNTYAFERYLNWTGVGIDINFAHAESWAKHRKFGVFIGGAVSDAPLLYVNPDFRNNGELLRSSNNINTINTLSTTIRPSHLCAMHHKIDLLSVDVEGMEIEVLKGVFEHKKPTILIVEHSTLGLPFDETLLPFITSHGYTLRHTTDFNYILTL